MLRFPFALLPNQMCEAVAVPVEIGYDGHQMSDGDTFDNNSAKVGEQFYLACFDPGQRRRDWSHVSLVFFSDGARSASPCELPFELVIDPGPFDDNTQFFVTNAMAVPNSTGTWAKVETSVEAFDEVGWGDVRAQWLAFLDLNRPDDLFCLRFNKSLDGCKFDIVTFDETADNPDFIPRIVFELCGAGTPATSSRGSSFSAMSTPIISNNIARATTVLSGTAVTWSPGSLQPQAPLESPKPWLVPLVVVVVVFCVLSLFILLAALRRRHLLKHTASAAGRPAVAWDELATRRPNNRQSSRRNSVHGRNSGRSRHASRSHSRRASRAFVSAKTYSTVPDNASPSSQSSSQYHVFPNFSSEPELVKAHAYASTQKK